MKRLFITLLLSMFMVSTLYAAQSTITEAEGASCMGEDKTKKQTMDSAMADAKRRAIEYVLTYVKSETKINNFQMEKDLIEAYGNASVRIIEEKEKKWYKDESMGDCFRMKIKAEVIPDEKAMERLSKSNEVRDDPSAPLSVQVWTDKKEYKQREKIRIYIKGNKPFYARVIYKDADGKMIQLFPNPYRGDSYFNGGTIYEIPSGEDRFELEVSPPFGSENIIVYASSSQIGDLDLKASGGVYEIKTKARDIGDMTRGIVITKKGGDKKGSAEFSETGTVIKTLER